MKQLEEKIKEVERLMNNCAKINDKENYWQLHSLKVDLHRRLLKYKIENDSFIVSLRSKDGTIREDLL